MPGYEVFSAKSRTLQEVSGVRDFGFKTSRPFGKAGKVPFKWPSGGPGLGYVFFATCRWDSAEGMCF